MSTWMLSLRECRWLYETHFGRPLPSGLAFDDAAGQVLADVGTARFRILAERARKAVAEERKRDGTDGGTP